MVSLSNVQSRINNKVFTGLGSTALVSSLVSSSSSKWGDNTNTYSTPVSELVVPYNYINPKSYEKFGILQTNEVDIFFNHLSTVNINSSVIYRGKGYIVTKYEDFPLLDGILAKLCRLSESI